MKKIGWYPVFVVLALAASIGWNWARWDNCNDRGGKYLFYSAVCVKKNAILD